METEFSPITDGVLFYVKNLDKIGKRAADMDSGEHLVIAREWLGPQTCVEGFDVVLSRVDRMRGVPRFVLGATLRLPSLPLGSTYNVHSLRGVLGSDPAIDIKSRNFGRGQQSRESLSEDFLNNWLLVYRDKTPYHAQFSMHGLIPPEVVKSRTQGVLRLFRLRDDRSSLPKDFVVNSGPAMVMDILELVGRVSVILRTSKIVEQSGAVPSIRLLPTIVKEP